MLQCNPNDAKAYQDSTMPTGAKYAIELKWKIRKNNTGKEQVCM